MHEDKSLYQEFEINQLKCCNFIVNQKDTEPIYKKYWHSYLSSLIEKMTWFGVVLLTSTLVVTTSGFSNNILLLKSYTKSNYMKVVLLISCERYDEIIQIDSIKDLHHNGLWINVWDISMILSSFDYHKFFGRYNHPPCIVINLECNQTKAFMAEMSKRIFFHYERYWLMFSEGLDEAYAILNEENINFDAEIILAIPTQQNIYDIYEVFNPSHSRGGRLNIATFGVWSKDTGWNTISQTKIERRHDLNGIVFPSVMPVMNIGSIEFGIFSNSKRPVC